MTDPLSTAWGAQRAAMGAFIRSQRELAQMSLRELSKATQVSNAYLSQVERGMHDPTLKVLLQIGDALQLSLDDMLEQAGRPGRPTVEEAVRADPVLSQAEKDALLAVYRSYRAGHASDAARPAPAPAAGSQPSSRPAARPAAPSSAPAATAKRARAASDTEPASGPARRTAKRAPKKA